MLYRPAGDLYPSPLPEYFTGLLANTFEEALDCIQPSASTWIVLIATFADGLVELLQQFLLISRQVDRCFYCDPCKQVTCSSIPNRRHTFAAQPENLAGLCTCRNLQRYVTIERWQFKFPAKCGFRDADGYLARQIRTISFEYLVCVNPDFNVQIARRTTISTSLAFAG